MWSPSRKVKVAILSSFSLIWNNHWKKIWTKNKAFFYYVWNFYQKFLIISRIQKVKFKLKIFLKKHNAKIRQLQKLPRLWIITLMVNWEEYINPLKSFSSRAHIGICQIAPRPLKRDDLFWTIIFGRVSGLQRVRE
jgi:hypothetical protein